MTDAPNGWPDPSKPGVPLHPERDGWHWLARNADDAWPFYWVSGTESGWCAEDGCNVDCADTEPEFMAHYWPRYLGPCHTPAEVAAREAAAAQAMEARKDAAYEERNRVVALLAAVFPSVRARTAIEGWSEDWHGCIYITLPTGQASWHYHDSHAHLFAHVPEGEAQWDGHTTPEKYDRVAAACAKPFTALDAVLAEARRDGMREAARMHTKLADDLDMIGRAHSKEGFPGYAEQDHAAAKRHREHAAAILAAAQEDKA
jgi:hypothetical protein